MNGYKLVEAVKTAKGGISDYAVAKLLGFNQSKISGWKKGIANPDGEATLRLAAEAGLSAEEALNLVTAPTPCAACGRVHDKHISCILC